MSPFIGTHECKVDSKGRFSIPAVFRRFLGTEGGETFVVTRGIDNCLLLYAPDGWQAFQEKLQALPAGEKKRQTVRFYSKNSKTVHLDRQGRVGAPKDFLSEYGIGEKALLVGALEYIEVWNPSDFDTNLEDAPQAIREMESLL